jgi:uncharacterized protein YndB with AHSA1/START domain
MSTTKNPTTITAQPGTPFLDIVREFDATPAQVYRASHDPELLVQWFGPRSTQMRVIEYDPRPGGRYSYVHRTSTGYEAGFRGVFHTAKEAELVIWTFEFDAAPDVVGVESIRYEDIGAGRTRLSMHDVYPSVEVRDAAVASGMEGGLVESMDRLAELLSSGSA